jgi:hypothetical protein
MPRRTLLKVLSIGCLTGLAGLAAVLGFERPNSASAQTPYNPYPPGILPPDLVQREMTGIFNEALGEWKALPPPTLAGQPPTLQFSGYGLVHHHS